MWARRLVPSRLPTATAPDRTLGERVGSIVADADAD
jgi:hypothetical protein